MSITVLMVLDGEYRFDQAPAPEPHTGSQDFTFNTLVQTLENAGMTVYKAHRDSDADADVTADENGFDFSSHDLLAYDVIWLFGYHGRNAFPPGTGGSSGNHLLSAAEHTAIEVFMDAGGGIFATGDHDSIGADTGGHIKRVRAMRTWFGENDTQINTLPAGFPLNYDVVGAFQADTVQANPQSDYSSETEDFKFFENQSDSIPQPITPTSSPAHTILRRNGDDITVYPDHMHEGNTLGSTELQPFIDGGTLTDFPSLDGHRELPEIIATGQSFAQLSKFASGAFGGNFISNVVPAPKTVNTLSTYDGRTVGVGRIVTGATFHHYIDINLTGDTDIDTPDEFAQAGPDAAKGQGYGYAGAEEVFADIKAVYVNITKWLARPKPIIQIVLERSTFSQDEATADGTFIGAFLVTVNALKPSQFPNGGITTLSPSQAQLDAWAPGLTLEDDNGITIRASDIDSDDPGLPDRLQRFTFTYEVTINPIAAFSFGGENRALYLDGLLTPSYGVSNPLTDRAWIVLVKAANPFMLDLANGNEKHWLSTDVRVFKVVAGTPYLGHTLVENATPDQARSWLQSVIGTLEIGGFEGIPITQAESALSPLPTTTVSGKPVYNFAIARVRLNGQAVAANNVRVFFRIFTTQTTAALTFRRTSGATPIDGTPTAGYLQTAGANPIALPGENVAGDEWLSYPMFAAARAATPGAQTDPNNVEPSIAPVPGDEVSTFFGSLIDTNLNTPYLPPEPGSAAAPQGLSSLLMGAHQCIVAQIEHQGTPIPNFAKPSTSDKLAQRNIAMSEIANPGLEASRMALHTFEIEATPAPIADNYWPDELLVDWHQGAPDGTFAALFIPTWDAQQVIELADRFYARHELYLLDEDTVAVPAGGVRYVPIPRHQVRQTGVVSAHFPLGVRKGDRYDVSIRQVTYGERRGKQPKYEGREISHAEALRLLKQSGTAGKAKRKLPRGAFRVGNREVLVTDTSVFDMKSDKPLLMKLPSEEDLKILASTSGRWRETIGAFQIGIPVSDKQTMRVDLLRLLALLRWRADFVKPTSRWYVTFSRYVELMTNKVRALGIDPFSIDPSPNPAIPGMGDDGNGSGGEDDHNSGDTGDATNTNPFLEPGDDEWLDDTSGLKPPGEAGSGRYSGKVSGLLYDHFGDFEGFMLETYGGKHLRFFSREAAIQDIANKAWLERYVVTVMTVASDSREVRRLLIRGCR
ncbi:hypothetical protein [Amphritea balenae]|uniref:Uncharacterized protein n=1 Tax=Amphritea balenae TaxID=452629 RepID=A0A3P1SUA6_9GAMM|nr:hypothetical protein [Amphritea balenae]RRD00741.1 hypothetical protein EHS89_06575 [Amphritea balenae]GGK68163.1 hypothetical protein GCM10007941_17960 [Amphritea balenae]